MLLREFNRQSNILVITAIEPFDFIELVNKAAADVKALGKSNVFQVPLLLDFRQVDLLRFGAEDFKKVIRHRLALDKGRSGAPCALVAKCMSNYGMLRMYVTYAEIQGLRDAGNAFITTDFDDAVRWLITQEQKQVQVS